MSELLDIYDENGDKIGVKPRHEVHRDGDWHKVFHCWVIYRSAERCDYIILQKRAPDKDTYPNMLDISAAGHYEAGESLEDGLREVREELGIHVTFDQLVSLGLRIGVARDGNVIDRQFADVFFLIHDAPLESYNYQRDEISGLLAFSIDDALDLCAGKIETLQAQAVGFDRETITISRADFIPTVDHYFYRVLVLAKRCLNGEEHLIV